MEFKVNEFSIQVYCKFEDAMPFWLPLLSNNSMLTEANLLPLENSIVPNISPFYAIVSKGGKKIGVIYYQMLHFNASFIDLGILNKWYYSLLQFFIRRIRTNLLICGNLFRISFKGFDGISAATVAVITKKIAENNLLQKKVCGVLIKDLDKKLDLRTKKKFAYRQMSADVTMEITLRPKWLKMEDYINDLTRKYKKRAKSILASKNDLEIRVLTLSEIKQYQEKMGELYQQIVKKQTVRLGVLNGAYFANLKQYLQENYEIFGFFKGPEMLAFSSHIYYKNEMEISYIGINYQHNNTYQLYFNILMHGLEIAIAKKHQKLELGRTAKEAKASMGAEPVENINYYCINNPFLNSLFNKIKKNFEKEMGENWANRQPLK